MMHCLADSTQDCVIDATSLEGSNTTSLAAVARSVAMFAEAGGATYCTQNLGSIATVDGTLRDTAGYIADSELRKLCHVVLDHSAFIDPVAVSNEENFEVVAGGVPHDAATVARALRGTVVSDARATNDCYIARTLVDIEPNTLRTSSAAIFVCSAFSAPSASYHIANHRAPPLDGLVLIAEFAIRFPNLLFAIESRDQVRKLGPGDRLVAALLRKLEVLDKYALVIGPSASVNLDAVPFRVNTESTTRLREHRNSLLATGDDGERRTYSYHGYLTPDEWRLYFYNHTDAAGQLAIGYIGRKIGI